MTDLENQFNTANEVIEMINESQRKTKRNEKHYKSN